MGGGDRAFNSRLQDTDSRGDNNSRVPPRFALRFCLSVCANRFTITFALKEMRVFVCSFSIPDVWIDFIGVILNWGGGHNLVLTRLWTHARNWLSKLLVLSVCFCDFFPVVWHLSFPLGLIKYISSDHKTLAYFYITYRPQQRRCGAFKSMNRAPSLWISHRFSFSLIRKHVLCNISYTHQELT